MDKVIVEEGSYDLVELFDRVSEEARKEKLAVPPLNKAIYWWTRKPLVVSRAVALTATLTEIKDVNELLQIGRKLRAYNFRPNLELFRQKIGTDPSKLKVLDPFCGAGNLLFEVKRLGLDCIGLDYNPVACLISKASLEYPSKFKANLESDVRKYGTQVIELVKQDLSQLYKRKGRTALAYLWSWCIKCPYCNQRFPLMNHMWFARTNNKKIGIILKPQKNKDFTVSLISNISDKQGNSFTQKGGKAVCISCKNTIDYKQLTRGISTAWDKELLGIVVSGVKGKDYELPSADDRVSFENSKNHLNAQLEDLKQLDLIPSDPIREFKRAGNLGNYGFTQ